MIERYFLIKWISVQFQLVFFSSSTKYCSCLTWQYLNYTHFVRWFNVYVLLTDFISNFLPFHSYSINNGRNIYTASLHIAKRSDLSGKMLMRRHRSEWYAILVPVDNKKTCRNIFHFNISTYSYTVSIKWVDVRIDLTAMNSHFNSGEKKNSSFLKE